eukprot:jgi/Botrbrau1/18585/Bobra.0367s0027.1
MIQQSGLKALIILVLLNICDVKPSRAAELRSSHFVQSLKDEVKIIQQARRRLSDVATDLEATLRRSRSLVACFSSFCAMDVPQTQTVDKPVVIEAATPGLAPGPAPLMVLTDMAPIPTDSPVKITGTSDTLMGTSP